MYLDRYEYFANTDFLSYEFFSEGPKGKIKKIIRFTPRNAEGITYFNLGFGDWNTEKNRVDDMVVTNNQDQQKILATVASAVLDFTALFPDIMVYAKGSTDARTRLYQMGIAANLGEIESALLVFGFIDNKWKKFEKNINYDAFLVLRKKL
ncbi:DUF6934 family protein [Parafilimonas sp.]|uniref:DUF6934 family protein n=1 Tax=Parafilimonas sp. TaxID=1969739 RepID=UPI0039E21C13